jgi:hypothetical protein
MANQSGTPESVAAPVGSGGDTSDEDGGDKGTCLFKDGIGGGGGGVDITRLKSEVLSSVKNDETRFTSEDGAGEGGEASDNGEAGVKAL